MGKQKRANMPRASSSSRTPSKKGDRQSSPIATGEGGELHQLCGDDAALLTTNQGIPIGDNQNQLHAGDSGPVLLEDFVLREKIFHFDHERIPERVVHARGSGAHGYFELTESLSDITRADIFQRKGERAPVFVRFSTVAGGAGSIDTPRDVRGFAVKFYTKQGNWDLVGNNIPVFFIQDAMKFPDLIHAVKMEADRGFPQAASAHDTFWDFISLMPESMHMVMWAMSDRTLPRSYRTMEGFGIHTFRFVNSHGDSTFVKFHWRPVLGVQSTVWDEAVKIAGADPDYHRRDLFEAIQRGDYPEWQLGLQLFDQKFADKQPFDVLDPTKIIPEEVLPLRIVGRLVLDRWPDNFFAETEQVAFCPANVPPGIDFSDDPLLQGRLFSYLDTQLKRLGGPNFHQIPINQPKGCPFMNFQRDGHMQVSKFAGRANYEPNSLGQANEEPGPRECPGEAFASFAAPVSGEKRRVRPESFADHYSQARMFYRSMHEAEQNHIVAALVFELSKVEMLHVRVRMLGHLLVIDESLAQRVAGGLGMKLPPAATPAVPPRDLKPSAALRIIGRTKDTLAGRTVGILIDEGSDAKTLASTRSAIKAAGGRVLVIAPKVGGAVLSDGSLVPADAQLAGCPSVLLDAVAVVLTAAAAEKLSGDMTATQWVADAFSHLKAIGYTKDALPLLKKAGVGVDDGVVELPAKNFSAAAGKRFFQREPGVRISP
jgi:catalase